MFAVENIDGVNWYFLQSENPGDKGGSMKTETKKGVSGGDNQQTAALLETHLYEKARENFDKQSIDRNITSNCSERWVSYNT